MSIIQAISDFIGFVPEGYEPLAYVVSAIILLFLLTNAFILIGNIIKKVGGL